MRDSFPYYSPPISNSHIKQIKNTLNDKKLPKENPILSKTNPLAIQ